MPRRRPRYSGTHPRSFRERYKEHAPELHPEHTDHLREKGRTPASTHVPVMVDEAIEHLALKSGDVVVDCTLGYGGHARAILERIAPGGRLIGLDVDGAELAKTLARLQPEFGDALHAHRMKFAGIAKALALERIEQVDAILADLGASSMQLDDPDRGFSVKHDGPLDLRMDDRLARTGAQIVNTLPERELADALRELADEPDADAIARAIAVRRWSRPFARTSELVDVVFAAKRLTRAAWREAATASGRGRSVHPAALAFQALRMVVNDELGNLRELLRVAPSCLKPGGRIVVISFHSGEDRLVKASFLAGRRGGLYAEIADEPLRPTPEECRANPRASPARLRFAVRAGHDV